MSAKKEELKVYAIVKFGYSPKFVMPYEDGIALMNSFKQAESYKEDYSTGNSILPLEQAPELSIITNDKYCEIKMDNLIDPIEENN